MPRMFDLLREKVELPSITISNSGQKQLLAATKSRNIDSLELVQQKYDQALEVIEKLLPGTTQEPDTPLAEYADLAYSIVDTLANQLILGDSLLELVAHQYGLDEFLPRHLVNVCILSLALGLEMRLNKSRLHILGLAALFHDLGILSVKELVAQPRALTPGQLNKVSQHVYVSIEAIAKVKGLANEKITEAILQHHERVNGQGYPEGLAQEQIGDYAKVIGLVDTYEAMTHQRPHRGACAPHHVLREIIGPLKLFFDTRLIKAMVNRISVYPVGSFVQLNSGDIAKVISASFDSPLRPLVLVILDAHKRRIATPKVIDLCENNSVYIKGSALLDEDK